MGGAGVTGFEGGVDTRYQRGTIHDESMVYEHKKHDGSLPLIGVNTFLPKDHAGEIATEIELIRSTEEEKGAQIANFGAMAKPGTRWPPTVSRCYKRRRGRGGMCLSS